MVDFNVRIAGAQVASALSGLSQKNLSPFQQVQEHQTGPGSQAANRIRSQQLARRGAQMGAVGGALGQIPGGRMMQGIGKAFAAGGPIAGMSMGVTAIVGIAKQLLGMSKIFGTFSKTFFQMMSMMVDLAIMPMIPHMMKFLNWWLREGTRIATKAGNWIAANADNIASTLKGIWNVLKFLSWVVKIQYEATLKPLVDLIRGLFKGGRWLKRMVGLADGGIVTGPTNALIGEAGPEAVIPLKGGSGGGGMEKFFNTITSGMSGTADIFASYQKKADATVSKINVSARRNMEQWYYEMLGGSIVPDTIDSIGNVYEGMKTSAEENRDKTQGEEGGLLSTIGGIFSDAWAGIVNGWNIAKDWAKKIFGWLNPFSKGEEPEVDGVSEEGGAPWYAFWKVDVGAIWASSKEFMKKVWGWLWPFGSDEEPEAEGVGEEDSSSWYEFWKVDVGAIWQKSKDFMKNVWGWLWPFGSDEEPEADGVEEEGSRAWYEFWKIDVGALWKKSKDFMKNIWGWLWPFGKDEDPEASPNPSEEDGSPWYKFWKWDVGAIWGNAKAWMKKAFGWLWPFGKDEDPKVDGMEEDEGSPWYKNWMNAVKDIWKKLKSWLRDKMCGILASLPNPFNVRNKAMMAAGLGDCIPAGSDVSDDPGRHPESNRVSQTLGNVVSGGKDLLGKLKFWQMGGVVPGGLGSPQLGMLHGGETILPTHLGTNWAAASSGNMISSGGKSLDGAGGGGGVFAPSVNRPMTVQIYTTENASDVITRLDRMASLEDAAFFSSV